MYNGTDVNCINQLRMRKAVFWKLSCRLRDAGLLCDSIHVSVEEQFAMFLHTVGHNLRTRVIGFFVKRSNETMSRYFNKVLKALCHLAKDMIKLRSIETHSKITNNPDRFHPYFEDCIGALDGTHIPAFVPENIVNRFRGRKGYPTQNVLAAVDFDLRFTYVLAGWEGSTHDSVVLKAALKRSNGIQIPEGKYNTLDKLDSDSDDCKEVAALAAATSQVSSSNVGGLKPNKKNFKRPGKPKTLPPSHPNKSKPRSTAAVRDDNDVDAVITSTLVGIKENLTKPITVPQDPNAPLWNMLKNIALPPEDRMAVGMHLCRPEFEVHRSFLMSMGEEYLERWVLKHLSGDDPAGL